VQNKRYEELVILISVGSHDPTVPSHHTEDLFEFVSIAVAEYINLLAKEWTRTNSERYKRAIERAASELGL
jgi:hypothetical protein